MAQHNNGANKIPPHRHTDTLVQSESLRSCLENLNPLAAKEIIICSHMIDIYRVQVQFGRW